MFSLSGAQTQQLALPISHMLSMWNSVRSASQCLPVPRPTRNPAPRAGTSTISVTAPAQVTKAEFVETFTAALKDFGLEDLSRNVKIETLSPVLSHATADVDASCVSAQSFFQNKNGFKEDQLLQSSLSEQQQQTFRLTLPNLSSTSYQSRWIPNSYLYQQSRGFKTKRHRTGVGFGVSRQQSEDQFSALKHLRESVMDKVSGNTKKAPGSDKLNNMLKDYDHSPEMQDKIKVSFAEGYAAHHKREPETGGWSRRLLRFAMYGLIIWLTLQLLQGYSALGDMKINVLKGERYEVNPEEISVTFDDVKGVDEAKQELKDVVEFLKDPEKFKALGAKLPKGVLLVGPPGIGKTLLARAVAGEAGVPFFHASGSEFDEIFVGTGAKRVRQLFDAAKVRAPCVIFIDEIDTVGAKRTSSQIHPYANQTINQLLSEMDGFQQNEGVIVLGATNRRDNLDKALLRPGRFDVEVRVFAPDFKGRKDILELYLTKIVSSTDLDIEKLARGTTGCTGADLENMVNQAALKAAMDGANSVTMAHMEFAKDKVLMGPAKKTKIPDDATNWNTAYHEAGHTLVAYYTKDATPIHKVTIIPRGMSLGHTSFVPEKEMYSHTKSQLLAQMDVAMGGRVAEELIFGSEKVTTGASSDFQQATSIATAMVKQFGMSEKVGVRVFDNEAVDSGLSMVKVNEVSPATTELLDSEIKRLLQESYDRAKTILKTHASEHKALAKALMKYETLDVDDVKAISEGKKIASKEPVKKVL